MRLRYLSTIPRPGYLWVELFPNALMISAKNQLGTVWRISSVHVQKNAQGPMLSPGAFFLKALRDAKREHLRTAGTKSMMHRGKMPLRAYMLRSPRCVAPVPSSSGAAER